MYVTKLSTAGIQGLLSTAGNVVACACALVLARTGDLARAFSDTMETFRGFYLSDKRDSQLQHGY